MSDSRAELVMRAQTIAKDHGGLATRNMLRAEGLTLSFIRAQERAGRWTRMGRHTLGITCAVPNVDGSRWLAVWESGPRAFLDGVSALQAAGLTGWTEQAIHVTVVAGNRVHRRPGVRIHRLDPGGGIIARGSRGPFLK